MKKVLMTLMLASMMVVPSSALSVMVNGSPLQSDVPPQIVSNRTMLPARAVAESLQSKVDWDGETRKVTITNDTTKIEIQINNKMAKVNEKLVELDVPAMIINGRTMLPLSFVANNMGWSVDWNSETKTASIKSGVVEKAVGEQVEDAKETMAEGEKGEKEDRKTEEMRREEKQLEEKEKEEAKKVEKEKEEVKKEEAEKEETKKVEMEKEEADKEKKSKDTNTNVPRLAPLPSPKINIGK